MAGWYPFLAFMGTVMPFLIVYSLLEDKHFGWAMLVMLIGGGLALLAAASA